MIHLLPKNDIKAVDAVYLLETNVSRPTQISSTGHDSLVEFQS